MPCHSYLFFDIEPSFHALSQSEKEDAKKAFASIFGNAKNVHTEAYGILALKAGSRLMLHLNASEPEEIQTLVRDALHTPLGTHLKITYTLLGLIRTSQYKPPNAPEQSKPEVPHKYLVVYPFTKTTEWHLLPFETRRDVMKAHVAVGKKFSDRIGQLLLYAYGIDDHEFIVSYHVNVLEDFQTLVMEMRETESRRHTKNDTPIFLGIHLPLAEALDLL